MSILDKLTGKREVPKKKKERDIFLLWGEYPKGWAMVKDLILCLFLLNALIVSLQKVDFAEYLAPKTIAFVQETTIAPALADTTKPAEKPQEEAVIASCEEAVNFYGNKYGVAPVLAKIVKAESGNDYRAKSKISTASGCAQFINGTWNTRGYELWQDDFYSKNVYSPKDNVELAAYIISKYGTGDWSESQHVWAK